MTTPKTGFVETAVKAARPKIKKAVQAAVRAQKVDDRQLLGRMSKEVEKANLEIELLHTELANARRDKEALRYDNGQLNERLATKGNDITRLSAKNDELRKENNTLRGLMFSATQELSRLRGYLEGRRDAEPPRMVPEVRQPAEFVDPVHLTGASGWGHSQSKAWYER